VAVVVVLAPIIVAVVVASVVTLVIVAVALLVETRNSLDVFLDLLINLIDVRPLLGHAEEVLDRLRPLAE
jgi:hypothetical protein